MGNFTNYFKLSTLVLLMSFVSIGAFAQTFPNGSQTLTCDAQSVTGCILVADDDPAPANPGDLVGFLLVDEDGNVVDFSNDGSFSDVPPGNYTYYYVSYDPADAGDLAPFFTAGSSITDLEDNAGDATIIPSDPVTVTFTPAVCEDFSVDASAICAPDNANFQVLLVFQGGDAGANGYVITDDLTGATYGPLSANSITFGPFAAGSGFDYTVSVADHPECAISTSVSLVDCQTTEVELSRFNGEAAENGNLLNWNTASETDAKVFIIEYSSNGVDFVEVGNQMAVGNSNVSQSYSFLHKMTESGVHYYRLKEVDVEGNVRITTNVITVERANENFTITQVYPVPATDYLNVQFVSKLEGALSIQIVDIAGKEVASQNFKATSGLNELTLNTSNLPVGNYFVSITDGAISVTEKFVKN